MPAKLLQICRCAEGDSAELVFENRTREWETAAAQIIANNAGKRVVTASGDSTARVGNADGTGGLVLADGTTIQTSIPAGGAGQVAVRPEKILLQSSTETAPDGANAIEATVQQDIFAGSSLTYLLDWQDRQLKVFVQNRSGDVINQGETVRLSWSPGDTVLLEG